MKDRRVKLTIFFVMALVLLAGVYFQRQFRIERDVTSFSELLFRLRGLDVSMDRDMERIAAFRMSNFDSLVRSHKTLRGLQERLARIRQRLFDDADSQGVGEAMDQYLATLQHKLDLLHRMEQQAAITRNSLLYLPRLVDQLQGEDSAHRAELLELLDRLYLLQLFPDPALRQELEGLLNRLQAASAGLTPVLRHARASLQHGDALRTLMQELASVNSARRFDRFHQQFLEYRKTNGHRAIVLGVVLLLLVLVLLGWLWRMLTSVQQARNAAERSHQRLQDAVNALGEGFALFDNRDRLLLCNAEFRRIYPWLGGELKPGMLLGDLNERILEQVERQDLEGKPLEVTDRGRLQQLSFIEQTTEGRWYLASNRRTSEGGVVWTRTDITSTREDRNQLRKLSRALEQSPVSVVITDVNGVIEYVNPKFEEVSGYREDELLGARPSLLKSGEMTPEGYAELWDTILSGKVWEGVFHNRRKDGQLYWESARIAPVRDDSGEITHFIGVKEDITELRRYQESLRMSATVINATSEGIVLTDAKGRVRMVNPAFTRITGYEPGDVLDQPVIRILGEDNLEVAQRIGEEMGRFENWSGEVVSYRKSGDWYYQWLSITTLHDEQGKPNGHVIIISDITQHKEDQARILFQANYDVLTGLPNRALLSDRLHQALRTARRNRSGVAVAFVDLDRFKTINDLYGHVTGDELLVEVAKRLREAVREADTVARFGGDEFVVVLEELESGEEAALVAKKILDTLCRPFEVGPRQLTVGASIGITLYPGDVAMDLEVEQAATQLLSNADMAMYQAKSRGRNQFQFFEQQTQEQIRVTLSLEQDLRHALDNEQFELYYQPIVAMPDDRLVSVEALLRWNHPKRGMIPPDRFIPLAEETGLIYEIGNWVIRAACSEVKRWHEELGLGIGVSVNLSARQRERGFGAEKMQELLQETGFPPEYLTLEITENLMMLESDEVISCLHNLKALGLRLSVDDFGTGYSSLSYLKQFPVDVLKIDRSFVRGVPEDRDDVSLVRAIVAMAQSLGIEVVAEGVETEAQREFLQALGCRYMQGYRFDPPLPAVEIQRKFAPEALNDRPIRSAPG